VDFWLETESINGADSVVYAYDDDGLLVGAGAGVLANDATSGFLESYTLLGLATAFDYNAFGELASDATTVPGYGPVRFRYVRDLLGGSRPTRRSSAPTRWYGRTTTTCWASSRPSR
jgi:hypothetical protein